VDVAPSDLVCDLVREKLGLTGTHVGCDTSQCGACVVHIDGISVKSCTALAVSLDGKSLATIEGLASGSALHPMQQAFTENHGLQCGFCTPGMLLTAQVLLQQTPEPTDAEIRDHLSGNVCRCTGYAGIVASVQEAARLLREQAS
jgi:carbon-monoxide dehydrogenase small subunit